MGNTVTRVYRSQGGFTLTELLVASAIFLILASALTTLFTSAVQSTRQGYASISAFEEGRQAMTVLSRDLTAAFTSREHGDVYNFYGRHNGFMFVGALEGGEIGRVTYAFHPTAASPIFETTITERLGDIRANLARQTRRVARARGDAGDDVQTAVNDVIGRFETEYGQVGRPDSDYVELNVQIHTESLVRFEEVGVSDLDSFNMNLAAFGAPEIIDWPYVDALNPANDATPGGDGDLQLDFLLSAINPDLSTTTNDLRSMYTNINTSGGWTHPVTGDQLYLRVLGRDAFQEILNGRKREFWIRMLSGESMGLAALSTGYWYDETTGAANLNRRRTVNEYTVADGIIAEARILDADGNAALLVMAGIPMDALDAEVKFSYGDGENAHLTSFNDYENLRDSDNPDGVDSDPGNFPDPPDGVFDSVPTLVGKARLFSTPILPADLIEADNALANNLLGNRSSRKNLGSPLAPRIPAVVTPQFWVTRAKRSPGSPDVRKYFAQAIQVPAATGRDVATKIALGPGASL